MKFSKKFIKATDKFSTFEEFVPAPYFRKEFRLDFIPVEAEITICGLGFYELYINGKILQRVHWHLTAVIRMMYVTMTTII